MSKIFFSSDTHFHHRNILQYSSRPFVDVVDMNQELIRRWNSVVAPTDAVYHLGDFTLTSRIDLVDELLAQLNGTIRLVAGNHDKEWLKKLDKLQNRGKIKWVKDLVERNFALDGVKYKIIMCHFPLLYWEGSHYGSLHLHGHSHGAANEQNQFCRRLDVGVDNHNYYPISLENVIKQLIDKPKNFHHERYRSDQ